MSMEQILNHQRSRSSIDKDVLAAIVYRGEHRYRHAMQEFRKMAQMGFTPDPRIAEMSRQDVYTHMQQSYYNGEILGLENVLDHKKGTYPELIVASNVPIPGGVGLLMSSVLIKFLGNDKQIDKYYNGIMNSTLFCAYAQTEVGTGSDVQNLKTMAVFDPASQTFEFHTPSSDSIKWWPGELGLSCTHAVVFARLISNGKDYGVQPFILQLRHKKTHVPLDGVEIGDIGPKLGYAAKDNGFLKFNRFKAPRICLLDKYISVDNEGNVRKQGNPKIMYSAMMYSRTALCIIASSVMFRAMTIGMRYSMYRTQFKDSKGNKIPIYNYQMQKDKLFSELSRTYLVNLAIASGDELIERNFALSQKSDFSELQSTHNMLCAFKAMFTTWEIQLYSNLIKACGGHGYSYYSGLPLLLKDQFANQILEGDNSLLLLQLARFLIKCFARLQKGKTEKLVGNFAFLKDLDAILEKQLPSDSSCATAEVILDMFKYSTCYLLREVSMKMFALTQDKQDPKEIWDTKVGVENWRLSIVFAVQLILDLAMQSVNKIKCPKISTALRRLLNLQAINLVMENSGALLHSGMLTADKIEHLINRKIELLEEIDPDSLVLAEAMQWPDDNLESAIGQSKADPYETLLHWAKTMGTLNQYPGQIHPSIPLYQQKVAKHREDQRL